MMQLPKRNLTVAFAKNQDEQLSEGRLAAIVQAQQEIVAAQGDWQQVMQIIVEKCQSLTFAAGAVLEFLEQNTMVCGASSGIAKPFVGLRVDAETSLSGYCAQNNQSVLCNDVFSDPRVNAVACQQVGIASMIVVSLGAVASTRGVLKVVSPELYFFSEEDLQVLTLIAGVISYAMRYTKEYDARQQLLAERTATLNALRESEDRFYAFLNNIPGVAFMKDLEGRHTYVNKVFQQIAGKTEGECLGSTDFDLWPTPDAEKLRLNDTRIIASRETEQVIEAIADQSGQVRYWLTVKFPFQNSQGETFLGGTAIDITDQEETREKLRISEERWGLALRASHDGLWDWNALTDETFYSSQWKSMLGLQESDIGSAAKEWELLVHPDDLPQVKFRIAKHLARKTPRYVAEYRIRCCDGSYKWVLARGQAIWNKEGKPLRMVGSHIDITERKLREEALEQQALFDGLTQVSSRSHFLCQLKDHLFEADLQSSCLTVCVLDIDNFKQINDAYGHAMGDTVLARLGSVLCKTMREHDVAGRIGGDEFAILLPNTHARQAKNFLQRIQNAIAQETFQTKNSVVFQVQCTFGFATSRCVPSEKFSLLEYADQALYQAKRDGRNRIQAA